MYDIVESKKKTRRCHQSDVC